ncbi:uncharacterized protein [Oryza sativa Japonica Group]|uniref:uncharacterized protein isoform X1 n=1 Tax=Oryza sativa subsp. japonica TaxID=39947 RepID=UPI000E1C1B5F|nr:uncharacterized protein LOC107277467 isoform X2 [Oryza sativa Japonica Group]
MPGKGRRRREKNYRAAHGGEPRLPPPPKQRELDALPSKLRRLIAIQEKHKGGEKGAVAGDSSGKQGESDAAKNKALAKIRRKLRSRTWSLLLIAKPQRLVVRMDRYDWR